MNLQPEDHSPSTRRVALETVLAAGGLALFLVMLYEMHTPVGEGVFITPPLIAGAGALLLWPLRKMVAGRAILVSGGLLFLLWAIRQLAGILVPFAIVYLLAYLLEPAVSWLRRRFALPRWLSALGFVVLVLGLLTLLVVLLVPRLVSEIGAFGARLVDLVPRAQEWVASSPLVAKLDQNGLIEGNELVTQIAASVQTMATNATGSLPTLINGLLAQVGALLGTLTLLTVLPVVLYYLLKDYPFITRRVIEVFPTLDGRRDYLVRAGGIVGSYLRGQLIIAAIAAFNIAVLLSIFGFPFAVLMGLVAGLLSLIPNIGALVTMILGVAVALIFGDPMLKDLIVVVAVLLGQSLLEGSILSPTILSNQVGLHPVLIILSLFVFGFFMGVFGLFIAVPLTALLMTFYKTYREEMTLDLKQFEDDTSTIRPAFTTFTTFSRTDEVPEITDAELRRV